MRELTPERKGATSKTREINAHSYEKIAWEKVKREQELVRKNTLVEVPLLTIDGNKHPWPVWNMKRYEFLQQEGLPATAHPKLWEQAKLNLHAGLYQVTERIYQVRGFDMANLSVVRGDTGWIVIDCLTSEETARAAFQLVTDYFGEIPIRAIILSHSHTDHYGGILGILQPHTDVYAPEGFMKAVIEENVTAGVAMSRRGVYMYGQGLRRDAKGHIDNGIGKELSTGIVTLTNNVTEVVNDGSELYVEKIIDGVCIQFQLTPGTEAPAEMNMYIPRERSLCMVENCTVTMHNLYTLRGARVRDPVAWAYYLQQAIELFGASLTSIFGVHNWPRFGNQACLEYMAKQRDVYQYINDQTLRLINKGYTLENVGRMIKLPNSLDEWYTSPFYGTLNHNAKGVYQKYLGWYNSNPVDLNKLVPEESAKKYVEYMGGEEAILEKARKSFEDGEYQWVAEVMKHVIYANPTNRNAKLLCADALEQLGYITESGPWRNEYLTGAQELRFGKIPMPISIITKEVLDAIPLKDILNLFSIRVDGIKAGEYEYKLNFIIPDRQEVASTEIKRGIFRYLKSDIDMDAEVTVTMWKDTLYELATTNTKSSHALIIIQGDSEKWHAFLSVQDSINPDFPIVTPVGY
ncbi:alkyl/aryl-sulfatase [Priestia taiwanensis]|uniref:Alkyl sulfatase n=1 Tax=Priestia taiwanensis TaxID=1347902 RepID=A0A917ERU8_9BACI|nr:alkyl sulfatase dimerization domain-containing protein [Priestia taiwanensis]MBM7364076.1 alkyl sulfatase BDS1-like metallo-beta-lactamase superfamily hydrolase [Priestia taiwanensis]GGE71407.1 alkyl sulfatase [Priestia taiwanensis]